MDTTSIFTTSCSTVRVETRTSTGKLMRVLWKTEDCSTRTVEKCFKLLLWTIMIPNGSWCSDVIRWEEGYFQHSSFLAGEATVSAWRFVVENGVLRAVWPCPRRPSQDTVSSPSPPLVWTLVTVKQTGFEPVRTGNLLAIDWRGDGGKIGSTRDVAMASPFL
ncbi:hypothetical protein F2Q69_00017383 [Brassica cretica]|uniref:Uncharacterized protein n=1 Tax=Brassica cretica TaxID=69181 RepID=A0A8S9QL75_BRACR|nr:hypothetical protein F2Q69_00017383 [Brassica cretica]